MDARVRKNLTIVACITPLLAPLAFVLVSQAGLLTWASHLVTPIIRGFTEREAIALFWLGWMLWTALCASWISLQIFFSNGQARARPAWLSVTGFLILSYVLIATTIGLLFIAHKLGVPLYPP